MSEQKQTLESQEILQTSRPLPNHVAIIMDGNNRWAKSRLMSGVAGHKAGINAVRMVVEQCAMKGVKVLTLFAFSSENWKRPKTEISALMDLLSSAFKREVKKLHKNNVKVRVIGDRSRFSLKLQKYMQEAEQLTHTNTSMTLVVAANYGGQWDILQATKKIAGAVKENKLKVDEINNEVFTSYLSLLDCALPDLCIRTGGEQRISNFLLWHFAYTEFYFTDVLWPDFSTDELVKAFDEYQSRDRCFGKTREQVVSLETSNNRHA